MVARFSSAVVRTVQNFHPCRSNNSVDSIPTLAMSVLAGDRYVLVVCRAGYAPIAILNNLVEV